MIDLSKCDTGHTYAITLRSGAALNARYSGLDRFGKQHEFHPDIPHGYLFTQRWYRDGAMLTGSPSQFDIVAIENPSEEG